MAGANDDWPIKVDFEVNGFFLSFSHKEDISFAKYDEDFLRVIFREIADKAAKDYSEFFRGQR